MKAGILRHKITIQHKAKTQDPNTGGITYAWVDLCKPWAEIVPSSGREFIAAQAVQSKVTGRITIRHRKGITNAMRILYRGAVYNIEAVLPDANSGLEYLTLLTSEGVNDG